MTDEGSFLSREPTPLEDSRETRKSGVEGVDSMPGFKEKDGEVYPDLSTLFPVGTWRLPEWVPASQVI